MLETDFMKLYVELSELQESLQESSSALNLADCRMIPSDVTDIRGEIESSACLEYNNELTRVQVRTVILQDTPSGKLFLGRAYGRRVSLPGGGYDMTKDHGDILETAKREAYEEFNFVLTDVENTGITTWRHRDDPWVKKHVKNVEDQWTGYYSYFVVGKVAGVSDNTNPEEINKWAWLPLEKLQFVNKELYSYVTSLDEAIHPDKKARTDIGEISYLCNSLETLRKILTNMEIQKTYTSEVRYEVGERDGNNRQRVNQMSLSTSRNLTGHAKRNPSRWGFGVILDGPELSKYYGIEPYNHAHHKLATLKLNKVVRLTNEAAQKYDGSRVILMFGEFGNRLISCADNADLKLYNKLIRFLTETGHLQKARTLSYYADASGLNTWRKAPFGREGGKNDSRFVKLLPSDIETLYVWPQPFSQHGVPVTEIDEYFQGEFAEILGEYTSFNEEEERIWVENNLINFVQIPKSALTGIILPSYFKEDYDKAEPTNKHIAWLKTFVTNNGLRVDWHEFSNDLHYKKEFEANDSPDKEARWSAINKVASDPKTILHRAVLNKHRVLKGLIKEKEKEAASPPSVVATAAVKLAIAEHMQDLTNDNYAIKYQAALDAAERYYAETTLQGKLTPKPKYQIEDLFAYYCPDPPGSEDLWGKDSTFEQDFPEADLPDAVDEKETLVASLKI